MFYLLEASGSQSLVHWFGLVWAQFLRARAGRHGCLLSLITLLKRLIYRHLYLNPQLLFFLLLLLLLLLIFILIFILSAVG